MGNKDKEISRKVRKGFSRKARKGIDAQSAKC